MATFLIGLVVLFVGAAIYGKFCEKVFGPDDRETPAYSKQDGVDYVPMRGWKNSLINLLNIAGTGPIIGPIQGILFGPIAFITIPIGNVIGGAMHDYFSGMICLRDGGTQMPDMVRKYSNKGVFTVYQIFLSVLLLLVGAVFIYTPGDIAATQVFGFDGDPDGRIAVAPQNVPDLQPLHVLHGVGSQGLAVLGQELPEEIPLTDCTDIFPIPADDGDGGIAVVPHLFQSLTEGAVIVQIGDAVLREQKISYVHFAASFLRAGARPYSAFPAF